MNLKIFSILLLTALSLSILLMPTLAQTGGLAKRVVVLSIDALKADMLWSILLNQSQLALDLPGFKYIFQNGFLAQGMIVSFPSSTAVSHAVISTGAPPGITGITGNTIHLPGTPLTSTVSGFNGSMLLAEPLWVTVDRQGLKAIVASFPQSDPWAWEGKLKQSVVFNPYDSSMGSPTYSTLYTSNKSIPGAYYLNITPASGWAGSLPGYTFYNTWEAQFNFGDEVWYFFIADTNGDSSPDILAIVPREKNLSNALAVLKEGEWSKPLNTTLTYKGVNYIIAPLFKALNLSLSNFKVYRSLTRPFEASPLWFSDRNLAWRVWNEVVVKTGFITDGDYYGLTNKWFDEDTYMETVHYTNMFFMEFTRWLIRNTDWNLLMTYTPIVDNVYHQFLGLIDPRMPYYNPSTAPKYMAYIWETIKWADEFVQMLISEVDLSNTAIIVVSDHGQWPVAKLIYVNNILEQAGFLKRSGGQILLNETIAWYNGYNQVFINLKGREQGGIVDPSQYDSVVNQVMTVLSSVRDPDTGEPVFSVVMKKSEAKALGLFGDRVGDIIISTKPGYAPYGGFSPTGNPFVNATPLSTITANHQDLPYYPELWAVFGAVGAGIGHGVLGLIQSTSIAPTVTALLGIDPPLNSIGTPLPILKPITITHTQVSVVTVTERVEITLERATTQTTTTTLQATTTLTTTQPVTTTVYETTSLALTSLSALIPAIAILVLIFILAIAILVLIFRKK